jgi:Carboxypeptidase regulatory-like domain
VPSTTGCRPWRFTVRTTFGAGAGARVRWSLLLSIGLLLCFAAPALAETSGISGKVSNAVTHAPIEGIEACAFNTSVTSVEEEESPGNFGCATTSSSGTYTISGLNAGPYDVIFGTPPKSSLNYVIQFYEDKSSFTEASTVSLTAGMTKENVNAELEPGAEISGTVTEASTGAPVEGILVCAVAGVGGANGSEIAACATTTAGGGYALIGLRAGSYEVVFFGGEKFATQAYDDKSTPAEAEPVAVSEGGTTSGIDAALALASSSPAGSTLGGSTIGPGLLPSGGLLPKGLAAKPGLSLTGRTILLRTDDVAVVKLRCLGSARCRSRLTLTTRRSARGAKKGVAHTVIISRTVAVSIAPGASAEVRLDLNPVGRDLLKAGGNPLAAHLDFAEEGQLGSVSQAKSVVIETRANRHG